MPSFDATHSHMLRLCPRHREYRANFVYFIINGASYPSADAPAKMILAYRIITHQPSHVDRAKPVIIKHIRVHTEAHSISFSDAR